MSLESKYYEAPEFWADGVLTNAGNLHRIDTTIGLVPVDVRSVLDLGCGNGVFANRLARARPDIEVTAADRSNEALKHVETTKFIADLTAVPRPDRSYDCVSCLQVIEHLQCETYGRALTELARVARRYLLIGVPFKEDLLRDFTRCPYCLSQFNLNFHFRSYDSATIRGLFDTHGFHCSVERNLAPARMLFGQKLYRRWRKALFYEPAPKFESPLCPVCGYENTSFETPMNNAALDKAPPSHGLKRLIKQIWPGYDVPGYWSVALYERRP